MVPVAHPAVGRFPVVLVTGFDPFGGASVNPSWLAAKALHGRRIQGRQLVGAQLPTVFGRVLHVMAELVQRHRPELVICTGLAGGRAALSLERVAINVNDARIPDNEGEQPVDTPVVAEGPSAYFSSLPVKAMLAALQREGIKAEVSQSAGTFVCNHLFYGLMHLLATQPALASTRAGLVHLPWLPAQGQPSMALDDMVRGLGVAIASALTHPADIPLQAGALA